MSNSQRAVLYLRCSTQEQETLNQRLVLEQVAEQKGWTITDIYTDDGVSGDGKKTRLAFNRLIEDATNCKFDCVLSWDVSRVSRNLSQLISFLNTMKASKIGVYLHQQQVSTDTPAGEMLMSVCGAFAQFELALQKERIRAGLARRKEQGFTLGRPSVYHPGMNTAIKELRSTGMGIKRIARTLEIGVSSAYKGLEFS